MKKILLIPSWYPNQDNPGLGSFFREQAFLMSSDYDIRVLAGSQVRNVSELERFVNTILFAFFNLTNPKRLDEYFLNPPLVFGFEYRYVFKFNYRVIIESFSKYFQKEVLSRWKPDLIHAHDTFMGGVCAQAISRKHRIPYIITEHNYLTFKKSETLMRFESAVSNAAYVLLVSEYQKRVLRLWNIGKNLIVTGNYVNDSLFRISDQENYKKFKIIFIGRYAHHKDFKTLFNTIIKFSELVDSNQYFFRIIGVQKKKVSHFTQSLDAKGLASCYQISEFLERQETAKEMRSSDVLLSTSIAETFGVTICEAMMSGKPVVSTNNGGFDEMYVERINGIKCPIGDADALACALYRVYNGEFSVNPEDIRNSVLHKFGAQAFKDKMSKIYENAISSS